MDNQRDEFDEWTNKLDFSTCIQQEGDNFLDEDRGFVDRLVRGDFVDRLVGGGDDLAIKEQVEVHEPQRHLNSQLNEELVGDDDVLIDGSPHPLHVVHVQENLMVKNVVQKKEPVNNRELDHMNLQQVVAISPPPVAPIPDSIQCVRKRKRTLMPEPDSDVYDIDDRASVIEKLLAVSPSFTRWGSRGRRRRRARVRYRSLQLLYQQTSALPFLPPASSTGVPSSNTHADSVYSPAAPSSPADCRPPSRPPGVH